MAEYDRNTRQVIDRKREKELRNRIRKLNEEEKLLAEEVIGGKRKLVQKVADEFYAASKSHKELTPSQWFKQREIMQAFVPEEYRESFLYMVDKLNQFSFSYGWSRRTMRTAGYGPQIREAFSLLTVYENFGYCKVSVEDYIYGRMDEETLDYVKNTWRFSVGFSYLYAAEIDRGNQKVIDAFKDLILSESNTAYLDQEMIYGIVRSDSEELHKLLCDLLLAARLQEGLRQSICEAMDEGTKEAFLLLLDTIEKHDLIRYSSIKRSISTWIGIFDENSVDRVNGKILTLMGQCLRDNDFCMEQLKTNDSIAISVALWAIGFHEAEDAVQAIMDLIDHGTKNQKLTASFYNQTLFDENIKIQAARKVMLEYHQDLELVAAFFPAYASKTYGWIRNLFYRDDTSIYSEEKPRQPVLSNYFESREEAEDLYKKFMDIYGRIPKKGLIFSPCIFPWYQVSLMPSEIIRQVAFIAYILEDQEKITEAAKLLKDMSGTYGRDTLLALLLYEPANQSQKELLIQYMGLTEEYTSKKAISLVKKMNLERQDYRLIEDMLRFKRSSLRGNLLEMLMKQEDEDMEPCLKRLLEDKKEEKRSAGLDLLLRLSKSESKKQFYEKVKPMASLISKPTDKEKILIGEILGEENSVVTEKGFGFYEPDTVEEIPEIVYKEGILSQCISLSEEEIVSKLKKLDHLIREHKDVEYESISGDKELIGNRFERLKSCEENAGGKVCLKNYPLEQELRDFYAKEIRNYGTVLQIEARISAPGNKEIYDKSKMFYQAVFGKQPFDCNPLSLEYSNHINKILNSYYWEFLDKKFLFKAGLEMAAKLLPVIDKENREISYSYAGFRGNIYHSTVLITGQRLFHRLLEGLEYWESDEEFTQAFYAAWKLEMKCREDRERNQFIPSNGGYATCASGAMTPIAPYWFLKAYHIGLISKNSLIQCIMNYFPRNTTLYVLTQLVKGEYYKSSNRSVWNRFFGNQMSEKVMEQGENLVGSDTWCGKLVQELYDIIIPVMVDTELRRGEEETVFSWDISSISFIQGIPYLVRILMALGKDPLDRDAYYSYQSRHAKRTVLSELLQVCYPAEGENGKTLKKALKSTQIKTDRLVEVAMYAPQWIDIIEECLGWKGLKSGCYYFMAHMNEQFDDQKKAIIAKYTPLSEEQLQDGAFDIDWFRECYGLLGEKNFSSVYKAAKYISDGQKHSRARKYADAATGKVTLEHLRTEIGAKRNKDLLMSYGLVPFMKDEESDMLERYQFIQNFSKEARQFGAQRRTNEMKAAQTALVNLSVHAGFSDVTRLTLKMETKLIEEFAPYRKWTNVDDVELCLKINEEGKSEILCRKGEKLLKSVPTRIGKRPYVLEVKEAHKKLKEQHIRAKKLMEEAMENGDWFTAEEVAGLMGNPVVKAILENLVFVHDNALGFVAVNTLSGEDSQGIKEAIEEKKSQVSKLNRTSISELEKAQQGIFLISWDGRTCQLQKEEKIRIAHPLDLYQTKVWHEYQKYLFDHQIRQPFKQVFRELYVKMPEELGLTASRMFAGNQIQPQKTVGCLRGRRWIADYEEGLQKVYYKENIIARIYAMADWFSPSDIEAPTLEWVEFSDRKTFMPITIEKVPDLIYSEVMRDVDLAVSVAHVGGVDPETSHSTIEMRRAIVEFNLPLFGLKNVTLTDSHAQIQGSRGEYTVHLGSGVIHQKGGAMLNILPVHSQKRGKLFLPFVDEDPKTAEIMSKIVLLAEDKKIKDPFILQQIRG